MKIKGFTLIELMITIAIIVILSAISSPIYKDYVTKTKTAEGYALLARIRDAQIDYYNENETFLKSEHQDYFKIYPKTQKYYTSFTISTNDNDDYLTTAFAAVVSAAEIGNITMIYDITDGATYLSAN